MEEATLTRKQEPQGATWRDVIRWVWDVFGPTIKAILGPAILSGGVVIVAGREFVTSSHLVPGWMIVVAAGVTGLCIVSVGLQIYRWHRRKRGGSLVIEHTGPRALWWQLGKRGDIHTMMPCGDFHIANRADGTVVVPRSVMVVSYRRWGFLPARRHVDGFGVYEPLARHTAREERLHWDIEPPILGKGETLVAKVCLIDHFGTENWTRWLRWPYQG